MRNDDEHKYIALVIAVVVLNFIIIEMLVTVHVADASAPPYGIMHNSYIARRVCAI